MILLETWKTQYGLAPFDRILDSDFSLAMDEALKIALDGILKIGESPETPTFENLSLIHI